MRKERVLPLRDQCAKAKVPFFFKQWGGTRKSKAERDLDGRKYDAVPGRVQLPVPDNVSRLAAIAAVNTLYRSADVAAEPSLFAEPR